MDTGGRPAHILEKVRQHYPIALHGTSLSIGSVDPLHEGYLTRLKRLVERIDPFIVSDHLCWSGVNGDALHDLLPLPFTEEAIQHVVRRVEQVQEKIGRRILLENVSTYVTYRHSTMPEWEFLTQVARRSGCGILLDLNNIYVNATNHKFDPHKYLQNIPGELVGQFHLAGHTDMGEFLFDTHSAPVIDKVWQLYREALSLWGPVSTLIEWDENIPPFERLTEEAERARAIYREFSDSKRISRKETLQAATGERSVLHQNLRSPVPLSQVQEWIKSKIQPLDRKPAVKISNETLLNPQGGVTGEERMSVYANGYLARIRESLKEVYEAVNQAVGCEKFSALGEEYTRAFPSRNYNLNYAGRHLADLLQKAEVTRAFPFLPDLAKLEWQIWEAFHAFDETPLNPSKLADLSLEDWEDTRIIFQPSVRLVTSAWPVLDIWLARQKPFEEARLPSKKHPERILVGRRADQVRCERLDENQYCLLEGLLSGRTLGDVCDDLAGAVKDETPPIAEWFARWVQDGLILRLESTSVDCASLRPSGGA